MECLLAVVLEIDLLYSKSLWNDYFKSTGFIQLKKYIKINIHPSIHYQYRFILIRVAGALEPIPADIGRRRGTPWTPWTGCQSISVKMNIIG